MSAWELSLLLACGLVTLVPPVLPLCLRDLRREMRRRRHLAVRRAPDALKDRRRGGAS